LIISDLQNIDSLLQTGFRQSQGLADFGLLAIIGCVLRVRQAVVFPVIGMGRPPIFKTGPIDLPVAGFPERVAVMFLLFPAF
jgi:hypothetical protein